MARALSIVGLEQDQEANRKASHRAELRKARGEAVQDEAKVAADIRAMLASKLDAKYLDEVMQMVVKEARYARRVGRLDEQLSR